MTTFFTVVFIVSFIGNITGHFQINYFKQLNNNWINIDTELFEQVQKLSAKKEEKKQEQYQ